MRRSAPVTLAVLGVVILLTWYVVYTQRVVGELRREASRVGLMYARVYDALSDPNPDAANAALLDLSRHIREAGVPLVVTDAEGTPTAAVNLPFEAPVNSPEVRAYIEQLDRENVPVSEPGVGQVHFGNTPLVRGLKVIPFLLAGFIVTLLIFGLYALRTRSRADREQIWAGMARESAHQLGTPLSSLSGWIELVRDHASDPVLDNAMEHMEGDLERLKRVSHRFERIGRPPKREPVDLGELVDQVAAYFRARVPTLAQTVVVSAERDGNVTVEGDAVLLEWAVEALVKNAIDALAGRGGHVHLSARALPEGQVRIRVEDDGPGVPAKIRNEIFEPGFSTKKKGWGIGLSLARRIVRDSHGGDIVLVPSDRGAAFEI
ncbi:MAG TPA: HAMP domain-containing sensor histidine kinase, partial [Gemmatimonadaceae bacterium]|nr:HAMP domain-containing sensor histidine kinase [Gemmatimonadaceae bacterium]